MQLIDGSELRQAARTLFRSPGFLAMAAGSLAVGVAMSVTMLGVLDAVVRPNVPAREIENLYAYEWVWPRGKKPVGGAAMEAALQRVPAIQGLTRVPRGIEHEFTTPTASAADARTTTGEVVEVVANAFEVAGVQMLHGRGLVAASQSSDRNREAVISASLWRRLYGNDRAFAPFQLSVGSYNRVFTVVGVARPRLGRLFEGDVWVAGREAEGDRALRVAPGVTEKQLIEILKPVSAALATMSGFPASEAAFRVQSLARVATPLPSLTLGVMLAALAVLLIACVNIANLLLARGLSRLRDLAVRVAVGASRGDIVRHQLAESIVIAAIGGAGGVVLSFWSMSILGTFAPAEMQQYGFADPQFSWRVFAAAIALTGASSIAFGLIPAMRVSRFDVNTLLQSGAGTGVTRTSRQQYSTLVAVEVAAAMALTICAGLLGSGLRAVLTMDYGYGARNVIAGFDIVGDSSDFVSLAARLRSLKTLPQVASATVDRYGSVDSLTVTTDDPNLKMAVKGFGVSSRIHVVDADYFRTLVVDVDGPGFSPTDDGSSPLAVLDSIAAHLLFGAVDPVGRMIKLGPPSSPRAWVRVVGVARHLRSDIADAGVVASGLAAQIFVLDRNESAVPVGAGVQLVHWFVRPVRDAAALLPVIRERVPFGGARLSLFDEINGRNRLERMYAFMAALSGGFSLAGVALAMLGVYSIVAHGVMQRRREFGVRIAFGATSGALARMVLLQTNLPVFTGLAIGLVAGRYGEDIIGYYIKSMADGSQVVVYGAAPIVIFAAALLASLAPALSAARTNPTQAIRGN